MAYIDKELLLKDIYKNVRFSVKSGVVSPELRGARKVIERIENAPAADVEEVVRCKDCKCCEQCYPAKAIGEEAIVGWYCNLNSKYVLPTHFCGYGERRDG